MKITNRTAWRTDDIRALLIGACRALGARTVGKVVLVKYARTDVWQGRAGGHASLGRWVGALGEKRVLHEGTRMTLLLPRPVERPVPHADADGFAPNLADIARTMLHEVMHWRGVQHRDMTPAQRHCTGPIPDWADGLDLRLAVVELAPAIPREVKIAQLVERREAHARAMLAKNEAKLDRARKLVAKWRAKVTGYERRAAAKGGRP